jgi:DNA-binding transcriptional regulator LsrR (DeoR family)
MLTPDQISEIHRLHWVEKWSQRKISDHLRIGRPTIVKYLDVPLKVAIAPANWILSKL